MLGKRLMNSKHCGLAKLKKIVKLGCSELHFTVVYMFCRLTEKNTTDSLQSLHKLTLRFSFFSMDID